jgi:hypothetical protein
MINTVDGKVCLVPEVRSGEALGCIFGVPGLWKLKNGDTLIVKQLKILKFWKNMPKSKIVGP